MENASRHQALMAAMFRIRDGMQTFWATLSREVGLTPKQCFILNLLRDHPSSIGTVQKSLAMNQGNVSTLCKKLEQAGLVERSRASDDERVVNLCLSSHGQEVSDRLAETFSQLDLLLAQQPQDSIDAIIAGADCFLHLITHMTDQLTEQSEQPRS